MHPQPSKYIFVYAIFRTSWAYSLEDFGDVSEIEGVMRFLGCRKQIGLDLIVDFDDSVDNWRDQFSDILREPFQEMFQDCCKDEANSLRVEFIVTHHVEMPNNSGSNLSFSSSRWTQSSQNQNILYLHELLIFSVVPTLMVQKLSQKLNRRLGFELFLLWHIQVINENYIFFAYRSTIYTSFYFL